MKKFIGVVAIVAVLAGAAMAWDDVNRTISKLGVDKIENPGGGTVTINDALVVNGAFAATSTNLVAGTTLNAVNGANVTNITAANIAPAATTKTFTNIVWNGGSTTGNMVFVNGRLIMP